MIILYLKSMTSLPGRAAPAATVAVQTADCEQVANVTLQQPGGAIAPIPFRKERGGIQFDVPGSTVAAVAELELPGGHG